MSWYEEGFHGREGGGGKHPATFLSNQAEAISMYMVNSALEFLYL